MYEARTADTLVSIGAYDTHAEAERALAEWEAQSDQIDRALDESHDLLCFQASY